MGALYTALAALNSDQPSSVLAVLCRCMGSFFHPPRACGCLQKSGRNRHGSNMS